MYDLIIVTQLPSFYKVNLYNKIAERLSIKVIFLGHSSDERTPDFVSSNIHFDHLFLCESDFESRNVTTSLLRLRCALKDLQYRKILCSGWNLPEFISVMLAHSRERNLLALESTIMESTVGGVKGLIKKVLLKKISTVLSSGSLHDQLLETMGYEGKVIRTVGVGLINRPPRNAIKRQFRQRFLFLGRLAPEKNLEALIQVFNVMPSASLSIAGKGPMEDTLKQIARENVKFLGHIPNDRISELFRDHDVLVLPSLREPWGLVVEEALYHQMPVLISDRCGASDLIQSGKNGYIFDPFKDHALEFTLKRFNSESYIRMIQAIPPDSLDRKDEQQVRAYLEAMA